MAISRHNIECIQLNCRSVNNKLGEIKLMLYSKKPTILAICETWITDAKYEPRFLNYVCEWKHRIGHTGGGLGLIIKTGVQYRPLTLVPFVGGVMECQAVTLYQERDSVVAVLNIYNPNKNVTVNELQHYLQQLGTCYLVVGDFNAHSPLLSSSCSNSNHTGRSIEDLILTNNDTCLANPIDLFTYVNASTGKKSCLDLCFVTSNLIDDTEVTTLDEIGSDHLPVSVTLNREFIMDEVKYRKRWKTTPDNLRLFSQNVTESRVMRPADIETMALDLAHRLHNSASESFSQTTGKPISRVSAAWWDAECLEVVRKRRYSWKLMYNHPTESNVKNYQEINSYASKFFKNKKSDKFQEHVSKINHEMPIGTAWKTIRSLKKGNVPENPPLQVNGEIIIDPYNKACAFRNQFERVSNTQPALYLAPQKLKFYKEALNATNVEYNREITIAELKNALSHCRDSSPGEDGIGYNMLRALDECNLTDLCNIFNQSFFTGHVPANWKSGLIIPILKPGKIKNDPSSYRPITLLSCIGKTMERIIKNRLEDFLERQNVLSPTQCGFRKKQGTEDVLLRLENTIRQALANQKICLVTYIDLKSAFDIVWPEGLKYKLAMSGVRGNMLGWLSSYLCGRTVKVLVGGTTSESVEISRGTPQGAVLSPILFNVMMADIPRTEGVDLYIYADDITISCTGENMGVVTRKLQSYLNKFVEWTQEWGLIVNPLKSKMQHFSKKRVNCPVVRLGNTVVEYAKTHRLLGLIFDSPLLIWKDHIHYLRNDCLKRIDLLKSISSSKWGASSHILRNFYVAYIRSKIDYGSIVYASASNTNLKRLDTLQNACCRLILGARSTSPVLSIQALSYIPPLKLHRMYLECKALLKLKYKPLASATRGDLGIGKVMYPSFNSFLWRAQKSMTLLEMPVIKGVPTPALSLPPWINVGEYIKPFYESDVKDNCDFLHYVSDKFGDYKLLYTDGSKNETSVASGIYDPDRKWSISWKLRPEHSVFSAELFAIYRCLLYVESCSCSRAVIFTDSLSSLQLLTSNSTSYGIVAMNIRDMLLKLNENGVVLLHWVRAHVGILGNESADRAANLGHKNNRSVMYDLTYGEVISILRKKFSIYWNEYWRSTMSMQNKGTFLGEIISEIPKNIWADIKSRKREVIISRLLTGHVGLREYLFRFGLNDDDLCPACRVPESIEHFVLSCQNYVLPREQLIRDLRMLGITDPDLKTIMGGNQEFLDKRGSIYLALIRYVERSGVVCSI